jgi:dTDP-4-amino-4,6-dideoxygalactose transaminase
MTVNSATAGLHAALAAIDVGPGDEVIVPPYTMSASASAILMHNAIPVFADIQEDIFTLDPASIKKAISSRTKAILVVHLFGHPADMTPIMKLAKQHKLRVIEDCAQAPGAIYHGKYVGTIGDMGIFSFNQHKTITTGEGGVVVTNDDELALRVRLVRNHGEVIVKNLPPRQITGILGWNYRMTELEAAVGIAQFRKLDKLTDHRIALANYLTTELKKLNLPGLILPKTDRDCKHVYFVYPIKYIEKEIGIPRNLFVKALNAEGIPFGAGYVQPIYLEPMYQKQICYGDLGCPFKCPLYKGKTDYRKGINPICERMHFEELFSTALCRYPLTKKDIDDVISGIKKVYENRKELK